jgi:hypothetical protein
MPEASPFELLAEELGAVAGRVEREASYRIAALIADVERKFAERELQIERLQKTVEAMIGGKVVVWDKLINDKLASLKDGIDGKDGQTGAAGERGEKGEQGSAGPAGETGLRGEAGLQGLQGIEGARGETGSVGEKGDRGEIGPQGSRGEKGEQGESIKGEKGDQGEAGPQGSAGEKGDQGQAGPQGGQGEAGAPGEKGDAGLTGASGERGEPGPVGKLPKVTKWIEGAVSYESDVVTHNGGLYQALKDTGKTPGTNDWLCLAAPGTDGKDGRDGEDGRSLTIRDTFVPNQQYKALDVVTLDSKWFVAKQDDPGMCPGPGWKAGPGIGRTGKPGERGAQGPKGDIGVTAPTIVEWDIRVKTYEAFPLMSDGTLGPPLPLRELFAQFQEEAGNAL